MAKLSDIEVIGVAYSEKLEEVGITSLGNLLKTCCEKKGRKEIAEKIGISEKLILNWVNRADLSRIKALVLNILIFLNVQVLILFPNLVKETQRTFN